jgi:twinkle protein
MQWAREYCGIREESRYDVQPERRKPRPIPKLKSDANTPPVLDWFKTRYITAPTLEKYRVVSVGTVAAFPCYIGQDIVHVKYRDVTKPKKEAFSTSKDTVAVLFGWQAIPDDAREIVITEGEPDALAYAEQGIAAVSVPMGSGIGANQAWIDHDWDRLERFDTIYVSTDMDEPGRLLADHIANRLGIHRCRIVTLPTKDANDAHIEGNVLSLFMEQAAYVTPKEVRNAASYLDDVRKAFNGTDADALGVALPWPKTDRQFRLRPGEVTIWSGFNGAGKSMLLSHIMVGIIGQGQSVAMASMEMSPANILRRMFQQIGACEIPSEEHLLKINKWITDKAWIIAIRGTAKADRLLELCEYCRRRFFVQHILIDSLAKCGMAEDDYNGQKDFVDKLTDFAAASSCHVHLICHARKGESEATAPNKMDVKGTGALTDMVDNVCSVWRNKPKEEVVARAELICAAVSEEVKAKADCIVQVQKQRHADWEGKIALWFDVKTHQYLAGEQHEPRSYLHD